MAFLSDILGPTRSIARGARLAALGLVVAVAAILGTQTWLGDTATATGLNGAAEAAENGEAPPVPVEQGRWFLQIQDEWESRLTAKAERALSAGFHGRVLVTVNLELDPRSESRSGVNIPAEGLQPNLVEVTGGESPRDRAIPADPNAAPAAAEYVSKLRRDGWRGAVQKKHTDPALYGSRKEVFLAPVIRRITASIVIDETALAEAGEAAAAKLQVEEIVKHAIGYDESRGDRIHEPAVVKFASESPLVAASVWGWSEILGLILAALFVIGGATLCAFAIRGHGSKRAGPPSANEEPEREESAEQLAERMRAEIEKAIDVDPAAVARTLGSWAMEIKA